MQLLRVTYNSDPQQHCLVFDADIVSHLPQDCLIFRKEEYLSTVGSKLVICTCVGRFILPDFAHCNRLAFLMALIAKSTYFHHILSFPSYL